MRPSPDLYVTCPVAIQVLKPRTGLDSAIVYSGAANCLTVAKKLYDLAGGKRAGVEIYVWRVGDMYGTEWHRATHEVSK